MARRGRATKAEQREIHAAGATVSVEKPIRAELSIYPLRQEALSPAIDAAVHALREAGLEPVVGGMSTTVQGDRSTLFAALDRAFEKASEVGDVVMTIHVSNACPA